MADSENKKNDKKGVSAQIVWAENKNCTFDGELKSLQWLRDAQMDLLNLDPELTPEWLSEGTEVKLCVVWPTKGIVVFSGVITYVIKERVHIGTLIYEDTIQRRQDVKVNFNGKGFLTSPEDNFGMQIDFKNISVGGIGFSVKDDDNGKKLLPGSFYLVRFNLKVRGDQIFETTILLLRAIEDEENGVINCGAQFIDIKSNTRTKLLGSIFALQHRDMEVEKKLSQKGLIQLDKVMQATAADYGLASDKDDKAVKNVLSMLKRR